MSLFIEPSTTVPATIPLTVNIPSAESHRPRTKTCFICARLPLLALPLLRAGVFSFFEVSSKNPSCSGV